MNKNSTLGELLYIVSCYEKGRVKSSGIWGRKYVLSLKNSLNIMLLLIDLIDLNADVTAKEILPIENYIRQNVGTVFTESAGFVHMLKNKNDTNVTSISNEKLITLMRDIINDIIKQLEEKDKKYKIKISYLLMALHNIPKVFLNPNEITLFNLGVKPITKEDAIEYANSYLLLKDKV